MLFLYTFRPFSFLFPFVLCSILLGWSHVLLSLGKVCGTMLLRHSEQKVSNNMYIRQTHMGLLVNTGQGAQIVKYFRSSCPLEPLEFCAEKCGNSTKQTTFFCDQTLE